MGALVHCLFFVCICLHSRQLFVYNVQTMYKHVKVKSMSPPPLCKHCTNTFVHCLYSTNKYKQCTSILLAACNLFVQRLFSYKQRTNVCKHTSHICGTFAHVCTRLYTVCTLFVRACTYLYDQILVVSVQALYL